LLIVYGAAHGSATAWIMIALGVIPMLFGLLPKKRAFPPSAPSDVNTRKRADGS
jgi:hypothetical protein